MSDIDLATVAHNVAVVRERIARAAGPRPVELLAVTKTFSAAAIVAVMAAGCRGIGENYAQELVEKVSGIPPAERPEIHFIGRLQTNKVKMLAGLVDVFETVDRPSLVAELARRVPGARCFVQVNVSEEPQKGGCAESAAPALVEAARRSGLTVMGLMTIGATGRPEDARPGFRRLRALADTLGLEHCSMGMSADLEVAVQEGATLVRVGSALFGPRVRRHDDRAR